MGLACWQPSKWLVFSLATCGERAPLKSPINMDRERPVGTFIYTQWVRPPDQTFHDWQNPPWDLVNQQPCRDPGGDYLEPQCFSFDFFFPQIYCQLSSLRAIYINHRKKIFSGIKTEP